MLSVLMLTACSELQTYSRQELAPVIYGGQGVNYWLAELHGTRDMTAEQLQQTLETWELDFRKDPTVTNRVRLALLLAVGNEPVRNPKRARKLLAAVDTSTLKENDQEIVIIFRQFLDQRNTDKEKINILWKQVTEQSRRIEELENQQKALTTIEKKIQEREKPAENENGK
jgi:hypothetical protein